MGDDSQLPLCVGVWGRIYIYYLLCSCTCQLYIDQLTMADQEAPAYVRNDCKTTFEQNLTYAHIDDTEDNFDEITFETAFSEYKSYMHAVHGMLYSMGQRLLWGRYTQPGDILVRTARYCYLYIIRLI